MIKFPGWYITLMFLLLLVACSGAITHEAVLEPTDGIIFSDLIEVSSTSVPPTSVPATTSTSTRFPSPTVTETYTPSATPTPNPYDRFTIDYLKGREYGGGEIEIAEILSDNSYFTRYLITYPSDELTIYGFLNIPKRGEPPYPVVIALHGYIDPDIYSTLDYTTGYADALSRAGFMVFHPNLRTYPPSSDGENLFRVGMAIDVLNLLAILEESAGEPGILELAKPDAVGIWGHSMGGGISLRVITVSPDIKAAVLYGAMSGDERRNFEAINRWSGGERGIEELNVPEEELDQISPIFFLDRIDAAVSIHHGESDELVPIQWSLELCEELKSLNKRVECFTYPSQPHTFNQIGGDIFNQRVIDFFNKTLNP